MGLGGEATPNPAPIKVNKYFRRPAVRWKILARLVTYDRGWVDRQGTWQLLDGIVAVGRQRVPLAAMAIYVHTGTH